MAPSGAPASGSGCGTSSQQVAQSNSTLNAWLPGRRQHSWLTTATPVQLPQSPPAPQPSQLPRNRAPKRRKSAATTTATAVAVETSACPASAPRAHQEVSIINPQPVLPSPAPSDDSSLEATNTHRSAQTAEMLPLGSDPASRPTDGASNAARAQFDRSYDQIIGRHDSSPAADTTRATATALMTHVAPTALAHDTSAQSATMQVSTSSVPSPVVSTLRSSNLNDTGLVAGGSANRRPGAPANIELIQSLGALQAVLAFERQCASDNHFDPSLESPRLQLLKDACEAGDLFYIALHQIFCLWAVSPMEVRDLFRNSDSHLSMAESAFGILGTILRSNANIRPILLNFFANFPRPFVQMRRDPQYSATLNTVLTFLYAMSRSWMVLTSQHLRSGFPLLMDEMLGQLNLHSQVLQNIVFRASRRTAGVPDGPISSEMDALFREDQRLHTTADGYFAARSHDATYVKYLEDLVVRYRQMVQRARALSRLPATSPHQFQPQAFHSHQISTYAAGHPPNRTIQSSPPLIQGQQWTNLPPPSPTLANGFANNNAWSNGNQPGPAIALNPGQYPNMAHKQAGTQPIMRSEATASPWSAPYQRRLSAQEQAFVSPNQNFRRQTSFSSFGSHPISPMQPQVPVPAAPAAPRIPFMSPSTPANDTAIWPTGAVGAVPAQVSVGGHNRNMPTRIQPSQPLVAKHISTGHLIPDPQYRIPPQEYPTDPHNKICIMHTLHQSTVRSPPRIPFRRDVPSERHYQFIKRLVLGPVPILPKSAVYKFVFQLSAKDRDRLSENDVVPDFDLPVHKYTDGTLRVRVRCCYMLGSITTEMIDSEWIVKDTVWPDHIFVEVNKEAMMVRRKAHHSKDYPIDVSPSVLSEENSLHIYVPESPTRPREAPKGSNPYFAVELLETLSHSAVLAWVNTHGVQPSEETLKVIQRRLSGTAAGDDDVAMMTDELAIDMADPFTSTIFKIPARGKACTHLECFDLETWLNTRLGKKKTCFCGTGPTCDDCPEEPSFVDKWKCPLCSADARPYSLRIDKWLTKVHKKLEADGKLRAKSILVSSDGSWKIKEMANEDDDEDNDEDDDAANNSSNCNSNCSNKPASSVSRPASSSAQPNRPAPIVIEIDDD